LWYDVQSNIITYINHIGGQAGYYNQRFYIAIPKWNIVKDYLMGNKTLAQIKVEIGC